MLVMDGQTLAGVGTHAGHGYPSEVCGLLLGLEAEEGDRRWVHQAHRVTNIRHDRARDRFELDPKEHLHLQRQARRQGLGIVGVYHSHPDQVAEPSETDLQRAMLIWQDQPSWSYLIVPVAAGEPGAARSWVLRDGRFEEDTVWLEEGGM